MRQDYPIPHLLTALQGPLLALEETFLTHQVAIESWFRRAWQKTPPLFYGSVDLRNGGFKLAPVDTNLFPAGFNNLNPDFGPLCVQAAQSTLEEISPDITRVLVIPESHSRNQFYFENVATLVDILQRAGFDVRVGSLDETLTAPMTHTLPSGHLLTLSPLIREGDRVGVAGFFPCVVILNNDLSNGLPDILQHVRQRVMPSAQLGWFARFKSTHFTCYDTVVAEFSQLWGLDPWLISPFFDVCDDVDFTAKKDHTELLVRAETLWERIRVKYAEYQIQEPPFLVVKADAGSYGMAVMTIQHPRELVDLNRKTRTKMATTKGGVSVHRVLLQEGVMTCERVTVASGEGAAEPVVYGIGRHVVGGFYRVHKNKGPDENLNSPGMDFQPLSFKKSCHLPETATPFYIYGIVARLAMVAAARELASFGKKEIV